MHWQKRARLAIAVFVVVFAAVVFLAMRQRSRQPVRAEEVPRTDPEAVAESGPIELEHSEAGTLIASVRCERYFAYEGGRTRCLGVRLRMPKPENRSVTATAREAVLQSAEKNPIASAKMTDDVRLETDDGLVVLTEEATYDDRAGLLKAPGHVEFSRGRMTGEGVGATYDRTRDVLWLLDQARIDIAPDRTGEAGARATADSAGLARAENYVRLTGSATIVTKARTLAADDITGLLREDGQTIEQLQLRGNSRITGAEGASSMTAADMDLKYAADGKTLESARLLQGGVVELPGTGTAPGRRVAGRTIDLGMSPDGTTVTRLEAREEVQVDLPGGEGGGARQIRARSLTASGSAETGLRTATFEGAVEYDETLPGRDGQAVARRTARSARMIVETEPGFGDIRQAEFQGGVRFTDGPSVSADAPRAVYRIADDRLDLSADAPSASATVVDDRVRVVAKRISLTLGTHSMTADTNVRSSITPRREAQSAEGASKSGRADVRMPSMLRSDQPVSVSAERLEYDGASRLATYTGRARLWQGDTIVEGDTVVVDEQHGNLEADGDVRTVMSLEDVDPATRKPRVTRTVAQAAHLVYDDAKRVATYTGSEAARAHMTGPQGDVTGDRIELYLQPEGNELERAEAFGSVVVKEGNRISYGAHLVYTAANETYVMTGKPVEIYKDTPPSCEKTIGTVLTFRRAVDSIRVEGNSGLTSKAESIPCRAVRR